jgi:hypothetical protein
MPIGDPLDVSRAQHLIDGHHALRLRTLTGLALGWLRLSRAGLPEGPKVEQWLE